MNLEEAWARVENPGDWLFAAGFLLVAFLMVFTQRQFRSGRLRREQDFQRSLGTLLLPREAVKQVVRAGDNSHWVLTGKRLLIQQDQSYTAVPLDSIKRVQGCTAMGKATSAPGKMARLTVTARQEYTLENRDKEFAAFAKALRSRVSTLRKKAAAKKAAAKSRAVGKKAPAKSGAAPKKAAPKKGAAKAPAPKKGAAKPSASAKKE